MSAAPPERRTATATGPDTRHRFRRLWDLAFETLRFIARHANNAYATIGIFLLIGVAVAIAGTWAFAELAGHVASGGTQAFDDAVLRWLGAHRAASMDAFMLDITALGTSSVVAMVVGVAALFLWLNRHKHSAILLLVSTFGGILLNNLLKLGFSRPRPDIIPWATTATFYSFPSGHAMSATVVYATVAYLAARLQQTHKARLAIALVATLVVSLICLSRLYLGVHYPSDVAAGVIVGLAWAGFCMATLEAIQLYARFNAPQLLNEERPAPMHES
ncbi:MAG TPA: phosphatase PAP2 family protein [Gemmatimonadaceae bacterium]